MTPLRDDPAFAWLSPGERFRIDALGWFLWAAFVVITLVVRQIVHVAIFTFVTPIFSGRISIIDRRRSGRGAGAGDQTLDPAGQEPSTGDRSSATRPTRSRPTIGPRWRARPTTPWSRPSDGCAAASTSANRSAASRRSASGSPASIDFLASSNRCTTSSSSTKRVARSSSWPPRGACSARPTSPSTAMSCVISTRISAFPSGATNSGWQIHRLRSGDPVMVVGHKQTVVDPGEPSFRGPQGRLALASAAPLPTDDLHPRGRAPPDRPRTRLITSQKLAGRVGC